MEPNEAKVWFYIKDRQQKGPIGFFELTKLLEQGVLNGETYLWTEGADGWEMAKTIEGLKQYGTVNSSAVISKSEAAPPPPIKSIVSFLAKIFDLALFTVLLSTFISIFSLNLILKTPKMILFIIYLLLWNIIEPIMLSIFGTTIGKSLFNIKIKCVNGELMNFITAFKRNLFIMTPRKDLRKRVRTIWDEKSGTIVLYGSVSIPRKLLGFCFPFVIFIAGIIIS